MYKRSMLFVVGLLCSLGMAAQLRVFQDDFESGFPGSWTQEQVKGMYSWERQTGAECTFPTGAHSGESRVWFYAPANDPATTRLVTPVIDASGLVTPARVNFWYALPAFSETRDVNDTLRVYARRSASDEWVLLGELADMQEFWTEATVALPMVSTTLQIAFEAVSHGGRGVVLDDVLVGNTIQCGQELQGMAAGKVTPESATLSWTRPNDFATYNVKVSPTAITDFTQPAWKEATGLVDNFYALDGLTPETTYYYYVQSDCGDGDLSPWTEATFTTDYAPVESFSEDFEDYPAANRGSSSVGVSGRWKGYQRDLGSSSGDAAYVRSGSSYAASGTYAIDMYAFHTTNSNLSAYSETYLVSPALVSDMDWSTKQLRFKMMSGNANGKLHIGVATHPNALDFGEGEFEEIAVLKNYQLNNYEEKVLLLNQYTGKGRYIVFYASGLETRGSTHYYLDDIVLEDVGGDCGEMQLLPPEATATTATGATLTWNGVNATSWNLKISSKSIDPETTYGDAFTGTVETTPTHTVNGLTCGTGYYAYVQPICADGVAGKWSQAGIFFTEVDAAGFPVPYYQGFDAEYETNPTGTSNVYDAAFARGWMRFSDGTSAGVAEPQITSESGKYYSAPGALRVRMRGNDGQYSMVALPEFTTPIQDLQLRFKIRGNSASYRYELMVGVVTGDSLSKATYDTYTFIDSVIVDRTTEWREVIVRFDQYEGDGGRIAILTNYNTALTSQTSVYIDDVYVEEAGGASAPTDFTGEMADNSTVNLSWQSDASKFEVLYGGEGLSFNDPANKTQAVTGTTATVSGLEANRTYEFYVRVAESDGTTSLWTGPLTFTTGQTAATLPYLATFEDEADNAQWTLLNEDFVNAWRIGTATKKQGSRSLYVTMPTNDNSYASGSPQPYLFAYRVIDMTEPGLYDIGFSWKAQGESTNDFMRVFVVPDSIYIEPGDKNGISATATPTGWRTLGGKYNLQSEWQDTTFVREMFTEAGKYKLVFYWTNNTSTNTSYPPAAAVDSVFFKKNVVCMTPIDVTVDEINDTDAELNFIGYNTEAWDLKLSTTEFDVADDRIANQTANVFDGQIDTLSYKMTGLQPSTTYYYYLRTPCNDEWQKGTFTTKCARQPLTVLEYFDESDAFPGCWTKLTNNTGNNVDFPAINTETYYNGKAALEFYAQGSTYYNAAVSPMLDVEDLSKVQVRFQGYSPVATGKLVVGAIEDAADYETIFPIDTLTVEEKGVWEYFEVPFDAYAGKGDAKYVVLMSEKQGARFLVDSVVIEPIPACRTPRDLVAKEDAYSAFLRWNGYGAGAFNVKVSSEPIDPATQPGNMYDSRVQHDTLTVNGLRPLTMYYWYVQAVCSDTEMGEWSKEVYFQTLCPYYSLPFRDSFDTYGTGSSVRPDCWNVVKANGNYPYVYTISLDGYIYSQPGVLYLSGGSTTNYNLIATPELYVDDISTLTVSFMVRMTTSGGQVIVGVMDDVTDIDSFVPMDTIVRVSSDWMPCTVDLSAYEGEGKYVAFSTFRNNSSNAVYLDDVVITNPNMACAMPENLMALGITDTQANLSWSDPADAEYYNLKVSTQPIVPDMEEADLLTLDSLDQRRHALTDLQPNTTYYVYVQCTCGEDGGSYWASTSFTTLCGRMSSYEDDFSDYEAKTDITELCWSSYVNALTGAPAAGDLVYPCVNNAGTAADANMALELDPFYDSDDGTTEVWAISPLIENLQGKQMTFRHKASYTSRSFPLVVGVMSDWSDVSTFVPVDTLYSNYVSDWFAHLVNFSEYEGVQFVAFKSWTDEETYTTNSNKLYVDDIVIEDIPACASAYDIEVTALGSDTATLTWKAGNAASNSWNYILTNTQVDMSIEGAVDSLAKYQVQTGSASAPTCTLEGLTADTEYWFYLTPSCGTVYFPQGVVLHTECDMKLEVPYYEDFSSYGTASSGRNTSFPTCWYRAMGTETSSTFYPYIMSQQNSSFPDEFVGVISGNMLYMYGSSVSGYMAYAATPEIDTDNMQSLRARFKAGASAAGRELVVGIASNQKDTATFVPLDTLVMENANELTEYRVPFENYEGTGKSLAFKVSDGHILFIGELNIEENTSCELPINAQAAALSDTSLVVSWDRAGADRWEVRYGLTGFDIDAEADYTSVVVIDTFCIINGLEQLTDYDIRVRTLCSDEEVSPWLRPFTVRTLQTPLELPIETAFEEVGDDKLWQITAQHRSANYPKWAIGSAVSAEENGRSLYLSKDDGVTSSYEGSTSKNYTFAYTRVNVTEGIYNVSFKWKGTGSRMNEFISLFLIPDSLKITDAMDDFDFFQRKDTILVADQLCMKSLTDDTWQQFERTLKITHSEAGIYQLAFYSENNDEGVPFAVDSVSFVRTAPTTPEFLRLESVTKNTATVDWLSYNASSYTVRLFNKPMDAAQVGDADDYVKEQTVYGLPATIEGLSAGTQYYMYVKADGGNGWAEMPFYTACDMATVNFPVLENFEGLGFGNYAYPSCWHKWNSMTKYAKEEYELQQTGTYEHNNMSWQYYVPYVADSGYYAGFHDNLGYKGSDGALFLGGSRFDDYYSMVISPEFDPEVLKDLHVQFYLRHMAASSSRLIVGVMTDAADPSTFIPLDSIEGMDDEWDDEPIKGSMRDYEAQLEGIPAKHFALKASNAVTTQLFIDDLRLGRWEDYDVYDQVCKGYSYRGHGFDIDAAELQEEGEQVFTRTALRPAGTAGSDSIIHLHLNVTETLYTYFEDEVCEGDVYTEHGFNLAGDELTSGEHRLSFTSVGGCDSVVVLTLTVNRSYLFEETHRLCPDQLPYTWHGRDLTETGVYYDSLRTVAGCDSIYVLDFLVASVETSEETVDICEADLPYEWNGLTLNEAGEYPVTLENMYGCDSIVTLNLRVHQPYDLREEVTICNGGSFSGFGFDNITAAGTYTHDEVSAWGCDSTFTLVVTVAAELATTVRDTICAGDAYDPGSDYTQLTETATEILYQKTIPSQAVADCDSTVTLVVTKLPSYEVDDAVNISEAELPYQYADTTFDIGTVSGEYTIASHTVAGCDSIVHLTLTVGGSGIGMLGDDGYFNITPNPVHVQAPAYIHYDFTEAEKDGMLVEVFTGTGNKVQGFAPEVFPINVGKYLFAPGVYMVRVTTGTGEVLVGRIIAR